MIGYKDIRVDNDGDLQVDSNGDFKLADSRRTTAQDVMFRIRTQIGDYKPHPGLGANLATMYGKENNRYNGSMIEELVKRSLTIDSRFTPGEFKVDVVPVSKTTVSVFVVFNQIFTDADDSNPLVISFNMNYTTGDITLVGNKAE